PRPTRVGAAVGAAIHAIPALDAALAAPRSPLRAVAVAVPLLLLTRWGRRLIPIT
ncbi:MAG: transferase, partial [Gemmatimonadetes bacterium]|nr:transferase [Gemmatimonadota bacterium]